MKTQYRFTVGIVGFLLTLLIVLSGQSVFGFNVTGEDLSENNIRSKERLYDVEDQKFSNNLYATQPYLSTTHAFEAGKFLDKNGKIKVPDINGKFNYADWTFKPAKRGLEGSFNIKNYVACVPYPSCNTLLPGDVNYFEPPDKFVGAFINIDYIPKGYDPTPTSMIVPGVHVWQKGIHWIQFIETKEGDGTSKSFIDVFPTSSAYKQPYYDPVGRAGVDPISLFKPATDILTFFFKDRPNRSDITNDHTWKAELYLVQETEPKVVTVYNGITWGWHNKKENDQISEPPPPCNPSNNQSKSEDKQDKSKDKNQCPIAANIWGDPHMTTFDGLKYDLQTLGEFTLAKSNRSDFEVQSRHTPWNSSGSLAISSAVAMKVGSDRVAIYVQGLPDADTTTPLRVNGKPTTLQGGKLALPGGGEILRQGGTYVMSAPTGEKVLVSSNGSYLNVSPIVDNRAGKYSGLLGNVNGNPKDDLQSRGGKNVLEARSTYGDVKQVLNLVGLRLPGVLDRAEQVYFDQLYKQFANSWRIKQEESLFDYPPGKTTESYVNPGFPDNYLTLNMLSADQIQKAQNACAEAKVTPDLMEGCIFDVGFSGFSGFARTTAEISGYIGTVNQLIPGLNIPTPEQAVNRIIEKVKPKVCLPFIGCI